MDMSVYLQVKTALTGASLTKTQAKELVDLIMTGIDSSTQNVIPFQTVSDEKCKLCNRYLDAHFLYRPTAQLVYG